MSSLKQKLWDAAWDDDADLIRECLEAGANVDGSVNGSTPLEAAGYHASLKACMVLLESGADPNAMAESTGESVLHGVVTKRDGPRTEIVKRLIAAGADVNHRNIAGRETSCFARDIRTRGESVLHRAAAYGDEEMIRALLAAGADKEARDAHGESPLTWASWHLRDDDVLQLLLHGKYEGSLPSSCP